MRGEVFFWWDSRDFLLCSLSPDGAGTRAIVRRLGAPLLESQLDMDDPGLIMQSSENLPSGPQSSSAVAPAYFNGKRLAKSEIELYFEMRRTHSPTPMATVPSEAVLLQHGSDEDDILDSPVVAPTGGGWEAHHHQPPSPWNSFRPEEGSATSSPPSSLDVSAYEASCSQLSSSSHPDTPNSAQSRNLPSSSVYSKNTDLPVPQAGSLSLEEAVANGMKFLGNLVRLDQRYDAAASSEEGDSGELGLGRGGLELLAPQVTNWNATASSGGCVDSDSEDRFDYSVVV